VEPIHRSSNYSPVHSLEHTRQLVRECGLAGTVHPINCDTNDILFRNLKNGSPDVAQKQLAHEHVYFVI
jgi:hypothetical protein